MSPITSKKNSAAKQKWMKENSKVFGVRVMKTTEKDLWDYLQDKEASAVFKLALREYMENHKEENVPDKPFWEELEEEEN